MDNQHRMMEKSHQLDMKNVTEDIETMQHQITALDKSSNSTQTTALVLCQPRLILHMTSYSTQPQQQFYNATNNNNDSTNHNQQQQVVQEPEWKIGYVKSDKGKDWLFLQAQRKG